MPPRASWSARRRPRRPRPSRSGACGASRRSRTSTTSRARSRNAPAGTTAAGRTPQGSKYAQDRLRRRPRRHGAHHCSSRRCDLRPGPAAGRLERSARELTVPQTCGPAAILCATLYALERESGLIPANSKPRPLTNPEQQEIVSGSRPYQTALIGKGHLPRLWMEHAQPPPGPEASGPRQSGYHSQHVCRRQFRGHAGRRYGPIRRPRRKRETVGPSAQ